MSLPRLALATTAALAAAICTLALMPVDGPSERPPAPGALATPTPYARSTARSADDESRATTTRWRLEYVFDARVGDRAPTRGRLAGRWVVEPLTGDRFAVRLEDVVTEGAAGVVDARALAGGAEFRPTADATAVAEMGFGAPTAPAIRRLYAEMASQTWLAEGAGSQWRAIEQDVVGTRLSAFRREGEVVSRTSVALTARRTAAGRVTEGLDSLDYDNRARFTSDGLGLAQIVVDLRLARGVGDGRSVTTGTLRLERIDHETHPRRAGHAILVPIERHFDPAALRADRDRATLGARDLGSLLEAVADLDGLDPGDPQTRTLRGEARRALTALLRLDPGAADAVADAVRTHPDDVERAQVLLGALGSAESDAGTDALAGLAADDALDPAIRRNAIDHISLGRWSTPAAVDALMDALDGEHDLAAAAALGSQARRLAGIDPAGAGELVETLLDRAMGATDAADRVRALQVLGNSGSPVALPYLRGLTGSPDPSVSEAAIYALRFIPGAHVDRLLAGMLDSGGERSASAVRAIAFRDPTVWRAHLEAARFGEGTRAAVEAERLLARWM